MEEKEFRDYEWYSIVTAEDGKRYMRVFGWCWKDEGYPAPYTIIMCAPCRIPLEKLTALDAEGRWDLIYDAEYMVDQYELKYTWKELVASEWGDPAKPNGVLRADDSIIASFAEYLSYKDITMDTPDGQYHYWV